MQSILDGKLSWKCLGALVVVSGLAFGLGLGSSTRLTYHEAFVAQGAREILTSGHWSHPTIGGLPWLEKPPLPFWLVASFGWCAGDITPFIARIPSALAAVVMVVGVALLASLHYGSVAGLLAGAIQITTAWTVLRGRLAEADILLACLVVWTLLAFDQIRTPAVPDSAGHKHHAGSRHRQSWRWAFFTLLGVTSLVKGTGFGAALVLSVIVLVLFWQRDYAMQRLLLFPAGWILVMGITLGWPLAMIAEHGYKVVGLWAMHITERVGSQLGHGTFARESWGEYGLNIFAEGLPWTPLAVIGAWQSLNRAWHSCCYRHNTQVVNGLKAIQVTGDQLFCAWAFAPLVMVSVPSARNAHYAIYALVPWSIWAALGAMQLGSWQTARGWSPARLRRLTWGIYGGLAIAYALCAWLMGAWFDRRGIEWAFYETTGRTLPPTASLILLYDDWDRDAYPTPFGSIPHDLAVRLFYLNRPACWHSDVTELTADKVEKCPLHNHHNSQIPMMVIGRDRDLATLKQLGEVQVLSRSSTGRWDRAYVLARVQPCKKTVPKESTQ